MSDESALPRLGNSKKAVCGSNGERSREQILTLLNIASEHWFADHPQSEPRMVAGDLPAVWQIAIDEVDLEAELISIEITRCATVGTNNYAAVELRIWRGADCPAS
jgi:hypothetical protein